MKLYIEISKNKQIRNSVVFEYHNTRKINIIYVLVILLQIQSVRHVPGAVEPLNSAVKNSESFSMARTTKAIIRSFKFFFIFLTDFSRFSSASISMCLKIYICKNKGKDKTEIFKKCSS